MREIPMQVVYLFVLGFFVAVIGSLIFPVIAPVIGALIYIAAAFLGYRAQASAGGGSFGMPALHRELAKTHCGKCGAPMRSKWHSARSAAHSRLESEPRFFIRAP
jgi:hypothetical protein